LSSLILEKSIIKIKKLISVRNSAVKKNFLALSVLQITNYIFPLITVPYISRIFGPDIYGLLNFAFSILAYFMLIVNYGFDLSASRDIAQNRDDRQKVNEIFNNVLFSKLFLYVVATVIFLIVLFTVNKIYSHKTLYLIMFFGGVFNIFFPTWYFQGIEKLTFTAFFTFIIRFIFTVLIFLLIKTKEDYLFYPIATICGQVLVSTVAMYLVTKQFGIVLRIPKLKEILKTIKESWRIFATTVVINLYTTTNIVLLGFLAGNYEVGIYFAAYKVVTIFMSILSTPLAQALYPNIGYFFSISYNDGINKIYKALKYIIPMTLIPSLTLFLFPRVFITLLFGEKFINAIQTLRILSFIPLIIGLSNIFGIQGLLNLKKDNYVYSITIVGATIGISLNFLLVPVYKQNGTAISWLITEIIITLLMFYAFLKITKLSINVKTVFFSTKIKGN
jgi:PST family polysaccharide transporter